MGLNMNLTEPQSKFFSSTKKHCAVISGLGSGKTTTLIAKCIFHLLEHRQNVAFYEPNHSLISSILYPEVSAVLSEIGIPFALNKSEGIMRTPYGNIYYKSMSNYERLVGYQVSGNFIDEMDTMPTSQAIQTYHRICARARLPSKNPAYKNIDINTNNIASTPEGFKACFELFVRNPLPDSELIQMPTSSNPYLPDGYIEGLKAQFPGPLCEAYLEGKFVSLTSGSVYPSFNRDLHVVRQTSPTKTEKIHVGMDFNVNKGSAIFIVQRKDSNGDPVWLVIDEITSARDTPDMIAKIKERYARNEIIIYPDASGSRLQTTSMSKSDHTMLRSAGFDIRVNSTNPRVRDRVLCVNAALEKGKLFISEGCTRLIDGLIQQVYDDDGTPSDDNDLSHRLDALGYAVSFLSPIATSIIRYRHVRHL